LFIKTCKFVFPNLNVVFDLAGIVDPENNVLQHYLESELVQLGLWGNVVEKNMRVKGTEFESLGFSFELPRSLMGIRGAVRSVEKR
jgi:hypothetical protein